ARLEMTGKHASRIHTLMFLQALDEGTSFAISPCTLGRTPGATRGRFLLIKGGPRFNFTFICHVILLWVILFVLIIQYHNWSCACSKPTLDLHPPHDAFLSLGLVKVFATAL